jgi:hypothetical protein
MSYLRIILVFLCVVISVPASETFDTLIYTTPLSAYGYGGAGVRKTGKTLSDFTPATEKKGVSEHTSHNSITAGFSGGHFDFIFSSYPSTSFSKAVTLSFWNDKNIVLQSRNGALSDSVVNLLGDTLPQSVLQLTTLNHIRVMNEFRVNGLQLLKDLWEVPFTINPYIGAGTFMSFSFGNTKQSANGAASSPALDSIYKLYDSTYTRFNADVGFAFPAGIEIFPLKNTDIPILNSMGITFTYTFITDYRVFAYPDISINSYKNRYNDNSSSINNLVTDILGHYVSESGSDISSNNLNKSSIGFFGFKKIKTDNEFRVGIMIIF